VRAFLEHPTVFGVVAAEHNGRVLGFNFLSERDLIRAVGPTVVDPAAQGRGVGRRLMTAVLDRAADAPGVRLAQEAVKDPRPKGRGIQNSASWRSSCSRW
jgi:GNAT superfamily N-acetyltransferase